jgi:hypothetical protein
MPQMLLPTWINQAKQLGLFGDDTSADEKRSRVERHEQLMWSMRTMGSLLQRSDLDPGSRENIQRTLLGVYGSLPDPLRPGADALLQAAHLTPEEIKLDSFKRQNPAPEPPRDANGVPLPKTPENESSWASFYFSAANYKEAMTTHAYGKDVAASMVKTPKLIRISAESDTWWTKDPQTQIPMPLPSSALGIDLDKAAERGFSVARMAMEGVGPEADPRVMTIGGVEARVTPVRNLETGASGFEIVPYGDEKPKALPSILHDGFLAAAMGDDKALEKLPAGTRNFAKLLMDSKKSFDNPMELEERRAAIQQFVSMAAPGVQVIPNYEIDESGKITGESISKRFTGFIPLRNAYEVEGIPFSLVKTSGMATFLDSFGKEGRFYLAETQDGKTIAIDETGQQIPDSLGKDEGSILENVEFGTTATTDADAEVPREYQGLQVKDLFKQRGGMEAASKYVDILSKEYGMDDKKILDLNVEQVMSLLKGLGKPFAWYWKQLQADLKTLWEAELPKGFGEEKIDRGSF